MTYLRSCSNRIYALYKLLVIFSKYEDLLAFDAKAMSDVEWDVSFAMHQLDDACLLEVSASNLTFLRN